MPRLTEDQKEQILAEWHTGQFSVRDLARKYKTSHTTVGKIVKGLEPKHKEKVDALVAVKTALAEESCQEVDAVNRVVEEQTRHLMMFQNAALKNQKMADELLNQASSFGELDQHSRITQRNKETVLGKEATTQITNINAQQEINQIEVVFVKAES